MYNITLNDFFSKGTYLNYVDQISDIFDPPPLRGPIYYYNVNTFSKFSTPLSVHVV